MASILYREEEMVNVGKYNFDHPDAFDWVLIKETFRKVLNREDVTVPDYNYITCRRNPGGIKIKVTDLVLFEGIFCLYNEELRDLMDIKVFVNTDDDIRLMRRI